MHVGISTPNAVLVCGDAVEVLRSLRPGTARTCVTSPPYYGLRDYGVEGQIGLEETPEEYVARLVEVFAEVWRVLADDGTLWLNLGDSYANDQKWGGRSGGKHAKGLHGGGSGVGRTRRHTGLKAKELIGIPWRVAFALQAAGWYLRSEIIWSKPNPMPESVTDRPTRAHEQLFLLAKAERYHCDMDAIREPATGVSGGICKPGVKSFETQRPGDPRTRTLGRAKQVRNRRDVWTIAPKPFRGAHFAVMPPDLVEPCILAGSEPGDVVLDPFSGAGTTGLVAMQHGRRFVGAELNPEYVEITRARWTPPPVQHG